MRWIWFVLGAVILLPILFSLLKIVTGLAMGVLHFAIILAVIVFLVGLIRRMLVRH